MQQVGYREDAIGRRKRLVKVAIFVIMYTLGPAQLDGLPYVGYAVIHKVVLCCGRGMDSFLRSKVKLCLRLARKLWIRIVTIHDTLDNRIKLQ